MLTNIILDMDGTLLDHDLRMDNTIRLIQQVPIPRPYLAEFMQFVFDHFQRVSIWTAASRSWYDRCYEDILRHHVPEGKSFHFVKTRENYNSTHLLKPLQLVYDEYPTEYTPNNTVIVDDNPLTYTQNLNNAVPVHSFFYDLLPKDILDDLPNYDNELLDIINILSQRLSLCIP